MKTKISISSKKRVTVLILNLMVYSLAATFAVNPVKAENGPILSPELRHTFCPFFVDNNISQDIGSFQYGFSDQPFMAGYMTTDYLSGSPREDRATAVRVTVSFKGTDNSVIQDGNALAAGIAIQGPSSSGSFVPPVSPYIDYGYTMLLVVDNQYDWPYIEGAVWSVYEWGLDNMWPLEQPVVYLEAHFSWEFPYVLKMDSEVTLIMKWNLNPNVTSYSVIIDDYPEYPIQALIPHEIQHPYFMLGTAERYHLLIGELGGTVKFFLFPGAWSIENIGQVGWHSYLSCPSFKKNDTSSWENITFAYSVNGTASWLDNSVMWGGACYDNVGADYTYQHVHFYPTSDGTTLEPDTLLWAPPTCAMKTKTDGYFYVPNVATDLLKIEMLFDNANLTGDQTGGTSFYSGIGNWPDGYVNAKDSVVVGGTFGSKEGDANWNYMADVFPDRKINAKDSVLVGGNFGRSGSYIYVLSGVTVTFNTDQQLGLDQYGCVAIPEGAVNFTVKRNGTPIGALVTFWEPLEP